METKGAFLHFVRSAVNSVIAGIQRNPELEFIHETLHLQSDEDGEQTIPAIAAGAEPDADASMVDLKRELFLRLRKRASRKLHASIDEWEKTFFWASYVPSRGKRSRSRQVRELAMRVLKEIDGDLHR